MMRVLSVLHFPVFGGPHNRNARVSVALREFGVRTTVLLPADADVAAARMRAHGAEIVQIPLRRIRRSISPREHLKFIGALLRDIRSIQEIIREQKIDLVMINGLMNPHAAFAAARENVPVVWQILDSYPPRLVRGILMLLITRLSSVIMCTGAQVAAAHPGATRSPDRLILFYPPVDLKVFKPSEAERLKARAELGVNEDEYLVGNVSNVNPMKGHMTFVRAAARLKKTLGKVKFRILGQTYSNHAAYAQSLYNEATRLGLEIGSDFQIVNPGSRVGSLAQAFDVFWMTSQPRSEGISTAVE